MQPQKNGCLRQENQTAPPGFKPIPTFLTTKPLLVTFLVVHHDLFGFERTLIHSPSFRTRRVTGRLVGFEGK